MDRVAIAAIGCGYWGPNLIRNFVEIPSCDLVAVADLDPDNLEAMRTRYPLIQHTTTNYEDLFDLDVAAVTICTPPETHYQIASRCLENGLHVLVEKPMVTNSDDARALIELANANGRVLMVGHTFEYNAAVRELKKMMSAGALGEIRYIDAIRVGLGLYHPSMNVLWDLAPHDVSILLTLLDMMPLYVSAEAVACVRHGIEDVAYFSLRFPSGVMTHVRNSWLDPSKTRKVTIVGSQKMVIYDDVEPNEKLKVYDKGVEALTTPDSFGEFQFNYRYGDILAPFINFNEPLRVEAEHFIDCIREGRRPISDGYSGLRVVTVIEALQESLRNEGRRVQIPPLVGAQPIDDVADTAAVARTALSVAGGG